MNINDHIRNRRFNVMWTRSHPQTSITEQQQILHLAERQMKLSERSEIRDFQRGILHEREVNALENIAIHLQAIQQR